MEPKRRVTHIENLTHLTQILRENSHQSEFRRIFWGDQPVSSIIMLFSHMSINNKQTVSLKELIAHMKDPTIRFTRDSKAIKVLNIAGKVLERFNRENEEIT